jgi:hypothetical protein
MWFFSSGFCLEVKKITFSSHKVEEFKGDEIDPCFESEKSRGDKA